VIEKAGDGDAIDAVYGKFGSRRRTDALLRKLRGGA
jgi:hypothetical protein